MNTKTMLLPPRRVTPSSTTNKRKEREDPFDRPKPTNKLLKPDKPIHRLGSKPTTTATTSAKPMPSNQLLAGYLAHEYLTRGTLLGQPWAPPQTEVSREEPTENDGGEEGEATEASCWKAEEERERYLKVADLVKGGGTHLPGVVNPTQLARFLHL